MFKKIVKTFKSTFSNEDITKQKKLNDLKIEISDVRQLLSLAWEKFHNTSDPNLVEAAIYEIKGLETKHDTLVIQIKKLLEKEF